MTLARRLICSLGALATLAPCGAADVVMTYQVSTDLSGNGAFAPAVDVDPGTDVLAQVAFNWAYPGAIFFGGAIIKKIDVSNVIPGDSLDIFVGSPGFIAGGLIRDKVGEPSGVRNQSFDVTSPSPSVLRIARPAGTPNFIQLAQETAFADPDYLTDNPIWAIRFLVHTSPTTGERTINIGSVAADLTFAAVFTSLMGSNHQFTAAERSVVNAGIHIVPAPGVLTLAPLALLPAARRRRP